MTTVPTMRNAAGADLVCLFVNHSFDETAGVGFQLSDLHNAANPDRGFSVVLASYAGAPDYMLAHELGHNLGATHDAQHREAKGATTFSNGWRFHGDDGVLYHDIMSYDPGQTIPYFSNPRLQYQNAPLGNRKTADSARTITFTAPYVASYRRARA